MSSWTGRTLRSLELYVDGSAQRHLKSNTPNALTLNFDNLTSEPIFNQTEMSYACRIDSYLIPFGLVWNSFKIFWTRVF